MLGEPTIAAVDKAVRQTGEQVARFTVRDRIRAMRHKRFVALERRAGERDRRVVLTALGRQVLRVVVPDATFLSASRR